ncbi:hypothetical protein COW36_20850 [bacterium (Candidatus Blackallbacteria) CG17_big_fil_post_rev_8_21_14_2_50_48_46]|uniref:FAD-binding PCMH-type domain-containing protein n=1 Tax=bacterium (Candidatus Blackallbacteria) CG17_big_fil_post_rev_8_21_14_2_50_48_46 TaxID=2014261 RepID=A0A2M7FYZ6_9BACT|nr:MAG: hypothetical protein COW64_14160 [bacterium (Candidatus Blackallbacteria) CG18_big_fil_WC_8_21_14_2_50_49_26]PIW14492.1 MAG: hypothetical protein COW36_20850 [bacterium (Candidatus Blackallbacteria) CG17_big_fil_post_rev_8_21_14_2_50_48_46]PIW47178.1 MAG: hypothetical protein COW20_13295 [bacterium (Candidatus Blackallbacteria) CG13_big_fil_rev_8_21_14_2_50_49_14]
MRYAREKLKWNGWGWQDQHFDFEGRDTSFWKFLQTELKLQSLSPTPACPLENLEVPASRLNPAQAQALAKILDPWQVKSDLRERVLHARGRSLPDLLDLRSGTLQDLPDAVVYPRNARQIQALLEFAHSEKLALVPFGGGSSVVGGVQASCRADQAGVLSLDLSLMQHLLEIDEVSLTMTAEAGIYGPELEEKLQARGYTVGHTPQSFEFSTLGGWIAARGAGDRSNRYGKVEDMLVAAKVLTPQGEWLLPALPASAAGPDLRQVLAGSEGILGVIAEATLKIHPLPPAQDARGFLFRNFLSGLEALRQLVQRGAPTAMLRLSDEAETQFLFRFRKKAGPDPLPQRLIKQYLASQGYTQHPALLLAGQEGEQTEVQNWARQTSKQLKAHGAFALGPKAAESWHKSRYSTPYLRDTLLDHGIAVETLETACEWRKLPALYQALKDTLQTQIDQGLKTSGSQGFVMTHISHCYPDGASLYFTFAFPLLPGQEREQYQAIKTAACETIVAQGATLSHHHGIGRDHAPWLQAEKGDLGMALLRQMRKTLDPEGILNPGKLLD